MWGSIEKDLEQNNIPSAAHKLRRGLEEFLHEICDRIKAEVIYKSNYQWTLGELIDPVKSRYSELLNKAKEVANSWGKLDIMEKLQEMEDHKKSIFKGIQVEQWTINPNVHYNEWANFSKEDFSSVVKTFKDFTELFKCTKCEGIINVVQSGYDDKMVVCPCTEINWNLEAKEN